MVRTSLSERMVLVMVAWLWLSCAQPRACSSQARHQAIKVKVPCFFIFGDSLVDNGNNNALLTLSRANYRPYGIDFPQGATGRFTNGRTFVDILGELMGFADFIPAFAGTQGPSMVNGTNFASGAAGIRDETGNNLGGHFSMNQQVNNFARAVEEIRRYFQGDRNAIQGHLSKCIIYSGIGSNDYLNNYFQPNNYDTATRFTPEAFAAALLRDYTRQLTELYQLGARKFVIAGVGPIGCIPYELARHNGSRSNRCNEDINNAIILFNAGVLSMVDVLNNATQLPGSKFVYLDSFQSSKDLYSNPKSYGFKVVDQGCCGVGRNNGQVTCLPLQNPCPDRTKYLFWDAFHPTETANIHFARRAFSSRKRSYTHPINIMQLAKL